MITVELRDMRMHAFHGIFEEEHIKGSPYQINLKVSYPEEPQADFNQLEKTIDYAQLFSIVQERMLVPTPLLEKVALSIIRRVKHQFPVATEISISIYKLAPPIPNLEGNVGVTFQRSFHA
ncbi:MAG: dihydroneopterin aldolase [Chitinophagaceae bacterium]